MLCLTCTMISSVDRTGVGRFRILGGEGQDLEYWGAKGGGGKFPAGTGRRNDVDASFRRRVPTRFLINQCQIITFLILKYDIIENSRIELRGIVLPVQVGGLLGGRGGGQRVCCPPPLKSLGGLPPPPPLAPLFLRLWTLHITEYLVLKTGYLWTVVQWISWYK